MSWSGRGVCSRGVVVGVGLARAPFSLLADGGGGLSADGWRRLWADSGWPCSAMLLRRAVQRWCVGSPGGGGHCGWVDVACVVDGWMFACVVDDVRDASSGLTG